MSEEKIPTNQLVLKCLQGRVRRDCSDDLRATFFVWQIMLVAQLEVLCY